MANQDYKAGDIQEQHHRQHHTEFELLTAALPFQVKQTVHQKHHRVKRRQHSQQHRPGGAAEVALLDSGQLGLAAADLQQKDGGKNTRQVINIAVVQGTEQEIGHGRRKKRPGKNRKRQQQADNAGHSPYRKPGNRRPLFRHYCR